MAISDSCLQLKLARHQLIPLTFAGQHWLLDGRGALYHPASDALLVADLHLGKGRYLSQFAHPIPTHDSLATLTKLQGLMKDFKPRTLVCLGDSFHDFNAPARMNGVERALLLELVSQVKRWIWIAGNHDPECGDELPGEARERWTIGGIACQHLPDDREAAQIVGHFHPKCRVRTGRQQFAGRCFVVTPGMLILPAFGQYTGGLSVEDPVLLSLAAPPERRCWMLYEGALYATR